MPPEPIVERHFPAIEGLIRRDEPEEAPELPDVGIETVRVVDPNPTAPSLVSSVYGSFQQLLLTIPSYAVEEPSAGQPNPLATVYRDLIARLPATCELVVVTQRSTSDTVRQWLQNRNTTDTVVTAPDHLFFSCWAEDGCVTIVDQGAGNKHMIEPHEFLRYSDSAVTGYVRNGMRDLRSHKAPLYFQGGNLLVGDTFFLMGADYPQKSVNYFGSAIQVVPSEKREETVYRLYREYMDHSRELYYVGSEVPVPVQQQRQVTIGGEDWTETVYTGNAPGTRQPLFHIDMFVTLAGKDPASGRPQVLVGDPGAAARALGRPPWGHSMQDVFDNIADQLKRAFEVIRNPLPIAYFDDPVKRTRIWYFATSNNALVQITGDGRKEVWLPTYGHGGWAALETTDKLNAKIWEEDLGFQVHMLADFHPFAERLGAVHCIKKYLARG